MLRWNNDRKEKNGENQRAVDGINYDCELSHWGEKRYCNYKAEKSILLALSKRTHKCNISIDTLFKEKWNYRLFLCNWLKKLRIWMIKFLCWIFCSFVVF